MNTSVLKPNYVCIHACTEKFYFQLFLFIELYFLPNTLSCISKLSYNIFHVNVYHGEKKFMYIPAEFCHSKDKSSSAIS